MSPHVRKYCTNDFRIPHFPHFEIRTCELGTRALPKSCRALRWRTSAHSACLGRLPTLAASPHAPGRDAYPGGSPFIPPSQSPQPPARARGALKDSPFPRAAPPLARPAGPASRAASPHARASRREAVHRSLHWIPAHVSYPRPAYPTPTHCRFLADAKRSWSRVTSASRSRGLAVTLAAAELSKLREESCPAPPA